MGGGGGQKHKVERVLSRTQEKNVTVAPKGGEHFSEGTDLETAIDQNETSLKMDSI